LATKGYTYGDKRELDGTVEEMKISRQMGNNLDFSWYAITLVDAVHG